MKKLIYLLSVVFVILLGVTTIQAQNQTLTASKWTSYSQSNGVEVFYKSITETPANTDVKEYIILKIVNSNQQAVQINWDLEVWYNGICRSCNLSPNSGYHYQFQLNAGQTLNGSQSTVEGLKFFSRFPNRAGAKGLTQFNLANFNIQ